MFFLITENQRKEMEDKTHLQYLDRRHFYPIDSTFASSSQVPHPRSEELSGNDEIVYTFNFIVERQCVYKTLLSILIILFMLIISLRWNRKSDRNIPVQKFCQILITVLNVMWIIGCSFLLTTSVYILFFGQHLLNEDIERLLPWYIVTIFFCCLIEMMEEMMCRGEKLDNPKHLINIEHQMFYSPQTTIDMENLPKELPNSKLEITTSKKMNNDLKNKVLFI